MCIRQIRNERPLTASWRRQAWNDTAAAIWLGAGRSPSWRATGSPSGSPLSSSHPPTPPAPGSSLSTMDQRAMPAKGRVPGRWLSSTGYSNLRQRPCAPSIANSASIGGVEEVETRGPDPQPDGRPDRDGGPGPESGRTADAGEVRGYVALIFDGRPGSFHLEDGHSEIEVDQGLTSQRLDQEDVGFQPSPVRLGPSVLFARVLGADAHDDRATLVPLQARTAGQDVGRQAELLTTELDRPARVGRDVEAGLIQVHRGRADERPDEETVGIVVQRLGRSDLLEYPGS